MLNRLIFILIIGFISCKTVQSPSEPNNMAVYNIQKTAYSEKAMVVSAHPEASKVGMAILKAGGNAIDAAIGVQFALAVVYPVAGNIGGGGFMVIRMEDGTTDCLDFREAAPLNGHRDMYLDQQGRGNRWIESCRTSGLWRSRYR